MVQCNGIKDLVFVPHQDDDLLFMNPDISSSIDAGGCVQVVYLTASERGEGEGYMLGRERGVRASYAYMAQEPNIWTEDFHTTGSRRLARFTLNGNKRVQLLSMRLKDPWLGKGWGSLTPLSQVESVPGSSADSLGPAVEHYTRVELVALIKQIIQEYQPSTVRHMDDSIAIPYADLCWRCAGHDHPDHIASARLVREAIALERGTFAEVAYVDYPSQERETNLSSEETRHKTQAFRHYAWNDYRYCTSQALCLEPAGAAAAWVSRSYYVSRSDVAPVVLQDMKGGLSLFAVGESNRAANVWQSGSQIWSTLGGRTADPIAAFTHSDGRNGIFARDPTGLAWTNTQEAQGRWQGWRMLKGARLTTLPIVSRGRSLMAIAMGNDGFFHYSVSLTNATADWTAWRLLPPLPGALAEAAIVIDNNGAPAVFTVDWHGTIWVSTFSSTRNRPLNRSIMLPAVTSNQPISSNHEEAGSWSPWHAIPTSGSSGGLAAILNSDGLIELFLRDRQSGTMHRMVQSTPGCPTGGWTNPTDLGIRYVGTPAVVINEKAGITIAAAGQAKGTLWLREDEKTIRISHNIASAPALLLADDALYLAARIANARQSYLVNVRTAGKWGSAIVVSPPPPVGGGSFGLVQHSGMGRIEPLKIWTAGRKTPMAPATLAIEASAGESSTVPPR
ncbi:PIG-L family deacetylase [Candidimonas sp. SYP-B2681]|uniref:PIG-L family deacetylase n=1 Tax=Candidimonas sp. SYP-B2681 TaxID=2497686 RepID=UPI000F89C6DE|nr:PIG-L family deacetylase [Candidimonas sp. SYP-B2681]RTZ47986.1 PIG-L family deacetylase [Candidimonas sp. SYP-B2681]